MAKVVGSVVSTQKDKSLVGRKLMIVRAIDSQGQPVRPEEVAVDSVVLVSENTYCLCGERVLGLLTMRIKIFVT